MIFDLDKECTTTDVMHMTLNAQQLGKKAKVRVLDKTVFHISMISGVVTVDLSIRRSENNKLGKVFEEFSRLNYSDISSMINAELSLYAGVDVKMVNSSKNQLFGSW